MPSVTGPLGAITKHLERVGFNRCSGIPGRSRGFILPGATLQVAASWPPPPPLATEELSAPHLLRHEATHREPSSSNTWRSQKPLAVVQGLTLPEAALTPSDCWRGQVPLSESNCGDAMMSPQLLPGKNCHWMAGYIHKPVKNNMTVWKQSSL